MAQNASLDPLPGIRKQFAYYRQLGEKTMAQLDDADLTRSPEGSGSSVAIIVKHLWGNMRSRWTDFLTSDGEKPWRNREAEFDGDLHARDIILQHWNQGWECLFEALDGLSAKDLERTVYIRNQGHTVLEAIHRQMMHYAYHVGQIVLFGKLFKGDAFQSLSIPRGKSAAFNETLFAQDKQRTHFTDGLMKSGESENGA